MWETSGDEASNVYEGFALSVRTTCIAGHDFRWNSQLSIKGTAACNVLVPAAIFITGNSYSSFMELCDVMNLQALSTRQCYSVQRRYIIPEVEEMWEQHNTAVLSALHGNPLVLSGDARCDSPGHCASMGTYSLLDDASGLIIAQETIHVTEVANSYWLEIEGMKRSIDKVLVMPLSIRLALYGCANRPFYHIVVIPTHRARNARPVEQLGSFDPMLNKHNERLIALNFDRLKFWIAQGAEITLPVSKLLGLSGYLPIHPMTYIAAQRTRKDAAAKMAAAEENTETSNDANS